MSIEQSRAKQRLSHLIPSHLASSPRPQTGQHQLCRRGHCLRNQAFQTLSTPYHHSTAHQSTITSVPTCQAALPLRLSPLLLRRQGTIISLPSHMQEELWQEQLVVRIARGSSEARQSQSTEAFVLRFLAFIAQACSCLPLVLHLLHLHHDDDDDNTHLSLSPRVPAARTLMSDPPYLPTGTRWARTSQAYPQNPAFVCSRSCHSLSLRPSLYLSIPSMHLSIYLSIYPSLRVFTSGLFPPLPFLSLSFFSFTSFWKANATPSFFSFP